MRLCYVFVLCLSGASTPAATCNPFHEIKFADGSKGCLTDYPFAATSPRGYRITLAALLQNAGATASSSIALTARGSACPVVAGFASRRLNNFNFSADTVLSEVDAEAVESCRKSLDISRVPSGQACDCEVAVSNGSSRFTRTTLDTLALHGLGSTLASRQQEAGPLAGSTVEVPSAGLTNPFAQPTGACKYLHGIKFVDGVEGCLSDYAFSKLKPLGFDGSIADVVNSAGVGTYTSIAVSENDGSCPKVAGYAARRGNNFFAMSDEIRAAVDSDALAACKKSLQGQVNAAGRPCGCDVVVTEGRSALSRFAFNARVSEPVAVADARSRARVAPEANTRSQGLGGAQQNQISDTRGQSQPLPIGKKPALTPAQMKAAADAAKKEAQAEITAKAAAKAKAQSEALAEAKAQAAAQAKMQSEALAEAKARAAAQAKMQSEFLAQSKALAAAQAKLNTQTSKITVRALVIGNGAYTRFGALANPRNDAQAIANKFQSFGIAVDLVLDANRAAIVDALNKFQANAVGKDVNILFYAGHSVQVSGINYLLPTDMQSDGISPGYVKLNAVSLNDALDYLPAKTRLVFLDACRDNPAARSLAMGRGSAAMGLAPVNVSAGTLIAYATKEGATAADGNGRNSPYTTALLQHLDAPLDISIILRRVRQSVMTQTSNLKPPRTVGVWLADWR